MFTLDRIGNLWHIYKMEFYTTMNMDKPSHSREESQKHNVEKIKQNPKECMIIIQYQSCQVQISLEIHKCVVKV